MLTADELEAFVRSFEACAVPRQDWTHQKHLLVALWYQFHYPRETATRRIRAGIRRYNESFGNLVGYHETITLAWVDVIDHFLATRSNANSIAQLAAELLAECGASDYLLRYYSRELLFSDDARKRFVPPDIQPIE